MPAPRLFLDVRSAPESDHLLRRREVTLCAISDQSAKIAAFAATDVSPAEQRYFRSAAQLERLRIRRRHRMPALALQQHTKHQSVRYEQQRNDHCGNEIGSAELPWR